jgi:N-acetylglucosaminyl-diphospho-decaprenol L-rhamnosyltransferase
MTLSTDVVVPAHNGWELTESCLLRLRAQSREHRVILVDNGSTDGTAERARASFPEVECLELGAGLGFTIACNRGAAAGEGEVIVLLNNDVDCEPDFIAQVVAPLEEDERTGSAAALLVQRQTGLIDSVGLTADVTLAGFPRLHGRPVGEAGAGRPVLTGPSGGAAAYRRAAWNDVGGLDEAVAFYLEDLDLALRLRSSGWKAAAATAAVGVHHGSATAGKRSAWQRRQFAFSRAYFLRRYRVVRRSPLRTTVTEAAVLFGDLAMSRDTASWRGRIDGWRAAGAVPPHPPPPPEAVDSSLGLVESLNLRRAAV